MVWLNSPIWLLSLVCVYFCFRWSWLLHWGIADPSSCSQLNNSSQAEVVKIVNSCLSDKPSKFSITVVQKSPDHMILFNPLYPPNPNQDHIEWSLIVNTLAPCSLNNVGGLKEKACQAVLPSPTAEDLGLHLLFHQQALSTTLPGCYLSVIQVCHAVNGVRLTSCEGTEDRTAMSVTREQCTLLRECHRLSRQHFNVALDCMRRFWFLLFSFLLLFLTHLKFFWCFFFFWWTFVLIWFLWPPS